MADGIRTDADTQPQHLGKPVQAMVEFAEFPLIRFISRLAPPFAGPQDGEKIVRSLLRVCIEIDQSLCLRRNKGSQRTPRLLTLVRQPLLGLQALGRQISIVGKRHPTETIHQAGAYACRTKRLGKCGKVGIEYPAHDIGFDGTLDTGTRTWFEFIEDGGDAG